MKKIITFVLICSVPIAIFFACSNGTEPEPNGNGDGDTLDTAAPYVSAWTPADGSAEVPVDVVICVNICDTGEYASGIDTLSIGLTINDSAVAFAIDSLTDCGVDISCEPPTEFSYDDTVTVCVDVLDTMDNTLHDCIEFYTESGGDTTGVSIDTLPPINGLVARARLSPVDPTLHSLYYPTTTSSYKDLGYTSIYSLDFTPGRSWVLVDPYSRGDVLAYNPDYDIEIELTTGPDDEKYPSLSPNGYLLAFNRVGNIMLKNVTTGSEQLVDNEPQGGKFLEFSPNGNYLAYKSDVSVNPKLFIWEVSSLNNIVPSSLRNDVDDFDWGPTGADIAVIKGGRLFYWDAEIGGSPDQLTFSGLTEYTVVGPFGDWIYYVDREPTGDVIRRVSPPGTPEDIYALSAATIEAIAISPDGTTLIYTKNDGGTYYLIAFDIGTSLESTIDLVEAIQIEWF